MKIAEVGDLHLGISVDSFVATDGNSRLGEQRRILWQILAYLIKNKIKLLQLVGDIFHTSNPTSIYRELFNEFLAECIKNGILVVMLVGNHDFNQSGVSALAPVKKAFGDRVIVIDEPTVVGDMILCAPHCPPSQSELYWEKVWELAKKKSVRYGIGHFHAIGAVTGTEQRMLVGGELAVKEIPPLDRWVLGHIHKPQSFLLHGTKIDYTGSIVRVDAGERNDNKSFIIHDTDKNTIERIPIDCVNYFCIEATEAEISKYKKTDWAVVSGTILKVDVYECIGQVSTKDIEDKAREAGVLMIKSIVLHRKDKPSVVRDKAVAELSPEKATSKYFAEYKNKKEITKVALRLLREVMDGKERREVTK